MLHFIMAATFKNIEGANYIALDINFWVIDRITNTSLSRKMDDTCGLIFSENSIYCILVFQIVLVEGEHLKFVQEI